MKIFNTTIEKFSRFSRSRVWRRFALIAFAGLALQTLLFFGLYRAALGHLRKNDPRRLQNRSVLEVYYAPFELRLNTGLTQSEIVEYLRELGYEERDDSIAGSYFIFPDKLSIVPRTPRFSPVTVTFRKDLIKEIHCAGQKTETAALEPLPMHNFIRSIDNPKLAPQKVRRVILSADAIPEQIADAVTATEDRRFFEHAGIDVCGLIRRVASGRGGGSSITQQLVKQTIFKNAKEEFWQTYLGFLPASLQRKLTDVFFALAAEDLYSKNEILAAYLSIVPLGATDGIEIQGLRAAAPELFGKQYNELNLSEAATWSGMIHQPSVYLAKARNNDYTMLIARRNRILDLMRRNHPEKYSEEIISQAKSDPLSFVFANRQPQERPADAYSRQFALRAAIQSLPAEFETQLTEEGAFKIITTLDYRLQKSAAKIAETAVQKLQARITAICRRELKQNCDQIQPQTAIVVSNWKTGEIVALVGGVNSGINYATAKRSPASLVKPFFYLFALERAFYKGQRFTPETLIDPENDKLTGYQPTENIGIKSTALVGLARSYNFHAVAVAHAAGLEESVRFVSKITNSQPETNGLAAIGGAKGSETSLLDLVQAYDLFPNRGKFVKLIPHRSFWRDDQELKFERSNSIRVADENASETLTEMLCAVTSPGGTAANFKKQAGFGQAKKLPAKTGSGSVSDLWFISFDPESDYTVGVWVGVGSNEIDLRLQDGFSGGEIAAPIAAQVWKQLNK